MKRLAFTLGLVIALAFPALAQQYTVGTLTLATNSVLTGATEEGNSSAITLTRYEDVALQFTFLAAGTMTNDCDGDVTFNFAWSPDGSNWNNTTNQNRSFVLSCAWTNDTTAVAFVTNVTVGAIGYMRLDNIINGDTNENSYVTNIVVKYALKPKRYGS